MMTTKTQETVNMNMRKNTIPADIAGMETQANAIAVTNRKYSFLIQIR